MKIRHLVDVGKNKAKQSQFKPNSNPISERPKMNVTSIITKVYENKSLLRPSAKQTQNKPNSNPIQTQFQRQKVEQGRQ